jgi:hypothetical protein
VLAFGDNVSYADAMVIMVVTVAIALLGVEGTVQHHIGHVWMGVLVLALFIQTHVLVWC